LQPIPKLESRVTDLTGTLTAEQQTALERKLAAFEARKGSQLALLIVPTTRPEEIEQYSIRVVDQWKLGRRKVDDGALLIIAKNDRTLRIEVGYGLEGVLTDATSNRIISETITPLLRTGDFYGGIAAGFDQMMRVIDGEPLPAPDHRWQGGRSPAGPGDRVRRAAGTVRPRSGLPHHGRGRGPAGMDRGLRAVAGRVGGSSRTDVLDAVRPVRRARLVELPALGLGRLWRRRPWRRWFRRRRGLQRRRRWIRWRRRLRTMVAAL